MPMSTPTSLGQPSDGQAPSCPIAGQGNRLGLAPVVPQALDPAQAEAGQLQLATCLCLSF